jgi:hypothetical protein
MQYDDPGTEPVGLFECLTCLSCWDGSELLRLQLFTSIVWTCGDPRCAGDVMPLTSPLTAADLITNAKSLGKQ